MIRTKSERLCLAEAKVVQAAVRWDKVSWDDMEAWSSDLDRVDQALNRAVKKLLRLRGRKA